eukprot:PhM_4_TR14302/c0_g1_i1/m.70648
MPCTSSSLKRVICAICWLPSISSVTRRCSFAVMMLLSSRSCRDTLRISLSRSFVKFSTEVRESLGSLYSEPIVVVRAILLLMASLRLSMLESIALISAWRVSRSSLYLTEMLWSCVSVSAVCWARVLRVCSASSICFRRLSAFTRASALLCACSYLGWISFFSVSVVSHSSLALAFSSWASFSSLRTLSASFWSSSVAAVFVARICSFSQIACSFFSIWSRRDCSAVELAPPGAMFVVLPLFVGDFSPAAGAPVADSPPSLIMLELASGSATTDDAAVSSCSATAPAAGWFSSVVLLTGASSCLGSSAATGASCCSDSTGATASSSFSFPLSLLLSATTAGVSSAATSAVVVVAVAGAGSSTLVPLLLLSSTAGAVLISLFSDILLFRFLF